jgi:hypothetical protein
MGAPAIFEKQIEIKLLHPASALKSRIQDQFKQYIRHFATLVGPTQLDCLYPASAMKSRIQVLKCAQEIASFNPFGATTTNHSIPKHPPPRPSTIQAS